MTPAVAVQGGYNVLQHHSTQEVLSGLIYSPADDLCTRFRWARQPDNKNKHFSNALTHSREHTNGCLVLSGLQNRCAVRVWRTFEEKGTGRVLMVTTKAVGVTVLGGSREVAKGLPWSKQPEIDDDRWDQLVSLTL